MYAAVSQLLRKRSTSRRVRRIVWAGLCVLGAYCVRVGARPPQPPAAPSEEAIPALTADERVQLEAAKDQALQHLAGGEYAAADRILSELAWRVPDEPLGLHNLVICRMLAAEAKQVEPQIALATVNQYVDRYPRSVAAHLLAAQMCLFLRQGASDPFPREEFRSTAMAYLTRAADLDSGDPRSHYALYAAGGDSLDAPVREQARWGLTQAQRLDPENLFLTVRCMAELGAMRDPRTVHILQIARRILLPFREGILARTGTDIVDAIDRAAVAVLASAWPDVVAEIRSIDDAVRGEVIFQSDKRRICPSPAACVIHRFSAEYYARMPSPRLVEASATPIAWQPLPARQQPPPMSQVRDLIATDFNLDGTIELLVLCAGELLVLHRDPSRGEWKRLVRQSVPEGLAHILYLDPHVILYGEAGVLVLRNNLDAQPEAARLTPVEQRGGLEELTGVTAGVLIDLDQDGRVDLAFGSARGLSIWRSCSQLALADISSQSLLPSRNVRVEQMIAVNWSYNDRRDVLVASPDAAAGLLENLRHGQFRWQPLTRQLGPISPQINSMVLLPGDRSGSWNFLLAGAEGIRLMMTASPEPGVVVVRNQLLVSEGAYRLLGSWDFDNDGYADLLASCGEGLVVFRGTAGGDFRPEEAVFTGIPRAGTRETAELHPVGPPGLALLTPGGILLSSHQDTSHGDTQSDRMLHARVERGETNPHGLR